MLDGYAAFHEKGASWLMTAELAVPQAHVNAVARAADAAMLHVTAIHNHTLGQTPRVKFIHLSAVGNAVRMARALKATIARTQRRRSDGRTLYIVTAQGAAVRSRPGSRHANTRVRKD